MKKILIAIFSICILSFVGCDDEYDSDGIAPKDDARIVRVSIDVRDVPYEGQRTFYNHELKEVVVQVLTGYDWTSFKVYVTPTMWSSMTPDGGQTEDWTSGSKSYTITSGDEKVSNTYTVKIIEVVEFGDNDPWN
ncbi:hypothetical protein EYV94_23120 [Puteibacter caeruleilacunae]|nr:hypothetical protein EYV94_23120 [Puteibacter caeruleilacunae]